MNGAIEKNLNEKGVLTLQLNRPEVLNAMNADLILGLLECTQVNQGLNQHSLHSILLVYLVEVLKLLFHLNSSQLLHSLLSPSQTVFLCWQKGSKRYLQRK